VFPLHTGWYEILIRFSPSTLVWVPSSVTSHDKKLCLSLTTKKSHPNLVACENIKICHKLHKTRMLIK
jgi:hypothetical protein